MLDWSDCDTCAVVADRLEMQFAAEIARVDDEIASIALSPWRTLARVLRAFLCGAKIDCADHLCALQALCLDHDGDADEDVRRIKDALADVIKALDERIARLTALVPPEEG